MLAESVATPALDDLTCTLACPLLSVSTLETDSVPRVVLKLTACPTTGAPFNRYSTVNF